MVRGNPGRTVCLSASRPACNCQPPCRECLPSIAIENCCPIRGNVEFKRLTEGYPDEGETASSALLPYFSVAVCGKSSLAAADQTLFFKSIKGGLASWETVALCWLQPSTSTEILISPSVK